jgi:hypothetical protein
MVAASLTVRLAPTPSTRGAWEESLKTSEPVEHVTDLGTGP